MKKLFITLAIAALAVPVGFAQQPKGKGVAKSQTQQTAAKSVKPVRQTVSLETLPGPTRDAVTKAIGKGKLNRLVSVTTNGTVTYEAQVTSGKKKSTMKFDAYGNAI